MKWFDDEPFTGFCRKRGVVPEKYLAFYLRRIKRFLLLESEPWQGKGASAGR